VGDDEVRRRVAAELRALADRLATDDHADDTWTEVADALTGARALLPPEPPETSRFTRAHAESLSGEEPVGGGIVDDPSASHPLATGTSGVFPPLDLTFEGRTLVAKVDFGHAWEGPPSLVHGGFLAAGFDIVLSAMAHHILGTSVTRSLQLRYLKPTFLVQDLRFEVEAGEPDGRLLDLTGALYADDRVTMRAKAQFATLTSVRFADRKGAASD
jgi:acyl-coenzyme A thioesterase PaaI-like protein